MLDELRKKPKHLRRRYAFWGAFGTTSVVALIWLVALIYNFEDKTFLPKDAGQTAGVFSQFFGDLEEKAGEVWQSGEEAIEKMPEQESGDVETKTSTTTRGHEVLIATSTTTQ